LLDNGRVEATTMTTTMRALLPAALLVLGGGCQTGIYLTDDEGGPVSTGRLIDYHADNVSLPYALGTSVGLSAKQTPRNVAGWSIVSDAPDVFAVDGVNVDGAGALTATGHALAEGSARVRILDADGGERHVTAVEVRAADTARFFSHGDLRVLGDAARSDYAQAELADARVVAGGKAVIAVAYFHAGQRVYGHGLATLSATPQLTIEPKTSTSAPINEWLFVSSAQPGSWSLDLSQKGVTLGTLPISAVADGDVTGLSIAAEPNGKKGDGDKTWLLARGRGSDGREVLGVYCDWTLDGAAQADANMMPATGDLYRYRFARGGAMRTVAAAHGGVTATIDVPAHDGYVSDTTYLGCSAAPGRARAPGVAWVSALVLALATVALRRRPRA
jgi:hypothetical protein